MKEKILYQKSILDMKGIFYPNGAQSFQEGMKGKEEIFLFFSIVLNM